MPKEEIQEEKNHHLLTWFSSKKDNMENLEETPTVNKCITPLEVNGPVDKNDMPPISTFLNEDRISQTNLLVPEKLVKSNAAWCFDIVLPTDKRSACFTHSYGKFVRGTGSVLFIGNVSSVTSNKDEEGDADDVVKRLKLVPPQERSFDEDWAVGLNLETNLRYFSGIEMARLMGFPVRSGIENTCERKIRQFAFPPDCTLKQQWKMIGNSLNVKVAAKVAEVGIRLISCTT
jgi:tRNA (cytosine38-C5)-methyltransferase